MANLRKVLILSAALLLTSAVSAKPGAANHEANGLGLDQLEKLGTVDPRYQSYNVEMVEVTGGRFWAPYGGPKGEMHRMRPPLDLTAKRIRALAKNLGPAYMRVSGTWANSTYLPAEGEVVTTPPPGFNQVLTRDQWHGVIRFAKAVNAKIVTSFPASPGARNPDGSWNPEQAQRLIDLTREAGGEIHSAELFNEPTIPTHGAFPKNYTPENFACDFRIFREWARKAAPGMKLAGAGGTAEGSMMKHSAQSEAMGFLQSEDLLKANPGSLDIVSYHFYGNVSQRCGATTSLKDQALSDEWLDRTLLDAAFYGALRDRYEPGKPLWLNETAQAACGGSPWASTFIDSFRYLNQLGTLAQKGVQVVAHNTLAASDYALIDYDTMMPRPNYWAAVLWHRTMGTTVLASPLSPSPDLRLYAHCLPGKKGGVGLLAINLGTKAIPLGLGHRGLGWVMQASPLDSKLAMINGKAPAIDGSGKAHGLEGRKFAGGIELPGQAIAFVAVPQAANLSCR